MSSTDSVPVRQRRLVVVAASAAMALVLGISGTTAAWTDSEWVQGSVGVMVPGDCSTNTLFQTTSWARQLEGSVLTGSLDDVAGVAGLTVSNDGETATPDPATATQLSSDTYRSRLDASVLGSTLPSMGLTLDATSGSAGAYTQWAQAKGSGQSHGAAGLVSDSGVADAAVTDGGADPPGEASIDLSQSLDPSLAGMSLSVGAVASSSEVDACIMVNGWPALSPAPTTTRSYGVSSLDLTANVPAAGTMDSDVEALVDGVAADVDELASASGAGSFADSVGTALADVVSGAATALGVGTPSTTVTVSGLDLSAAYTALGQPPVASSVLSIDPGTGTVQLDLEEWLNGQGPGAGLNGRSPNTELVAGSGLGADIAAELEAVLTGWLDPVQAAVESSVGNVVMEINTSIPLTLAGVTVASVTVHSGPATISQLADGTVSPVVTTALIGNPSLAQQLIINPALATITAALTGADGASDAIAQVVQDSVLGPGGLVEDFATELTQALAPVESAVDSALALFASLVSVRVNVQPDQAWPGGAMPLDVTAGAGEYKVSAIRVGLLNPLSAFRLSFGNSSAGPQSLPAP